MPIKKNDDSTKYITNNSLNNLGHIFFMNFVVL